MPENAQLIVCKYLGVNIFNGGIEGFSAFLQHLGGVCFFGAREGEHQRATCKDQKFFHVL